MNVFSIFSVLSFILLALFLTFLLFVENQTYSRILFVSFGVCTFLITPLAFVLSKNPTALVYKLIAVFNVLAFVFLFLYLSSSKATVTEIEGAELQSDLEQTE